MPPRCERMIALKVTSAVIAGMRMWLSGEKRATVIAARITTPPMALAHAILRTMP